MPHLHTLPILNDARARPAPEVAILPAFLWEELTPQQPAFALPKRALTEETQPNRAE